MSSIRPLVEEQFFDPESTPIPSSQDSIQSKQLKAERQLMVKKIPVITGFLNRSFHNKEGCLKVAQMIAKIFTAIDQLEYHSLVEFVSSARRYDLFGPDHKEDNAFAEVISCIFVAQAGVEFLYSLKAKTPSINAVLFNYLDQDDEDDDSIDELITMLLQVCVTFHGDLTIADQLIGLAACRDPRSDSSGVPTVRVGKVHSATEEVKKSPSLPPTQAV